ncbi:hypothetical protein [Luteolibacter luteus]|uniref:DUF1570 domain-containing protein n=1 Tax=Luteolibacter luteus TaxID=2728835 RepID=A0A858RJ09_9BACT|nr:hypothetical protein [Luteolibacter luteus]QJE96832.1 hypothetical protein HHL09_13910 [Luteolibacter luteus]
MTSRHGAFLSGLLFALSCAKSHAEQRTWTNTQGRTFQAEFVKVDGANAIFAFENGRTFATPVADLSPADRQALVRLQSVAPAAPATPGTAAQTPVQTNFGYAWPREIRMDGASQSKVVSEDAKTGRYIYESPHYRFTCDARLTEDVLRNFAMMFETTHKYATSVPLALHSGVIRQGRLDVLLFQSMNGYIQAGGPAGSAGCYVPSTGVVMVPMESLGLTRTSTGFSLDTAKQNKVLIHELAHQLTTREYMRSSRNGWLVEGLAEYLASTPYTWGHFRPDPQGNIVLNYVTAYGEDGRFGRNLGKKLRAPRLKQFLLMDYSYFAGRNANFNYGFALLLTHYFLHMEGGGKSYRITEYLKALRAGKNDEDALAPLLGGSTFEKLEKEFADAWRKKGIEIEFVP